MCEWEGNRREEWKTYGTVDLHGEVGPGGDGVEGDGGADRDVLREGRGGEGTKDEEGLERGEHGVVREISG